MGIRKKRIALAILAATLVAGVVYIIYNIKPQVKVPNTISQWNHKYPSVFNNSKYTKLIDQTPRELNELQTELIGISTNQFGVRDDILDYILTFIPEHNYQARVAAIKRAKFDQSEIGLTDSAKLNEIENKASAAIYCLNLSPTEAKKFIKKYDSLLRNTIKRSEEQNRIEHLLSGYVISPDFGIENSDFSLQCRYFLGLDK